MLVEEAQWLENDGQNTQNREACSVSLTGVVRGRGLNADRLVQVGDWGEFQIEKIIAATLGSDKKSQGDEMVEDDDGTGRVLLEPTADQDDLADLAPEDVMMLDVNDVPVSETVIERKGVLLDDHHYFSDDGKNKLPAPKRLPKGTSSYQSAWFLDDISDSESDLVGLDYQDVDFPMTSPALPQDGTQGFDLAGQCEQTEYAPSEAPRSEMFLDPSPEDEAEQLAAFRLRQNEAKEDLEFPDEIELHPTVLARERLSRYRGLKNLRTSHWETEEDRAYEPEEWGRLLRVPDYKKARNRVEREALVGGIQVSEVLLIC
jgi:pre-rRNA-processing protein TSR1